MMRAKVLEVFELDRVLLLFVSGSNTWRNECQLVDVPVEVDVRDGARRWLRTWLLDKMVWVECGKCDGYGRILGVLYMDADFATSVNAHAGARYGRAGHADSGSNGVVTTRDRVFTKQLRARGPRASQRHSP
jgi:hypothetical protein